MLIVVIAGKDVCQQSENSTEKFQNNTVWTLPFVSAKRMEQMTSVYELRPSFILLVHKLHHSGLVEKRTCLVVISLLGTVEKMTGDVDRALKDMSRPAVLTLTPRPVLLHILNVAMPWSRYLERI